MKSGIKQWLFDIALIVTLTGVAAFLLPVAAALSAEILSMRLAYFVPHIVVGCLLGVLTSLAIRHKFVWVAILPAILLLVITVAWLCFGSHYSWGKSRQDLVFIGSWFLLVCTNAICARFVLKYRAPTHCVKRAGVSPHY
jgi:hypothetical protein